MEELNFIFADTETTGAKDTDTVCEVGWLRTDINFKVLEQVESLIDPGQMISPSASGIHGLVNSDVESYPTLQEFFTEDDPSCHGQLFPGTCVIIGHRIGFDLRHLKGYFENEPSEICTLRWSRKLYPDLDDHKLQTMLYALDLPKSEGAHRVMADVWSAYYLTKHICERTGMNLAELAIESLKPMEILTWSFGKYKGQAIADTDKGYLRWCLDKLEELDPDLEYTIRLHLTNKNKK